MRRLVDMGAVYIHGVEPDEQARLAKLGDLTNAAFLVFLELERSSRVLDVGCGLGILTGLVADRVPDGCAWGVEASADQLARAVADRPNVRYFQGDAHSLPFDDDQFDVVFCRYVLEHVGDPVQVVREMRRVLRSGGKAFFQENNILINDFDPDCPAFDRVWEQFAKLQERLGGDALMGKRLKRVLRQAGFTRISLSIQPEVHSQSDPTFEPWVRNLIGNFLPAKDLLVQHGLVDEALVDQAVAELEQVIQDEDGSAFFYWNRAKAIK